MWYIGTSVRSWAFSRRGKVITILLVGIVLNQMLCVSANDSSLNLEVNNNQLSQDDEALRQDILSHALKAAQDTLAGADVAKLTQDIRELKQLTDPSEEVLSKIKELEKQRILLLRQGMLYRQFQIPAESIHSDEL
jgi:hypothetical protein